jgi:tetratricopeptide (TPR) repeat protein
LRVSEYDRAKQELDISLNTYESIADLHGAAIVKTVIGELGYMTAQFDEAIPILEECLEYLLENEDWRNAGYAYMNLGIIHARQNKSEKAQDYFEQCLDAMQKTQDPVTIAQSYNNLAIILETQDEIDESFAMHEKALEIRRTIKDKHGIAYSLSNLAGLVLNQGRHDEARAMQQEALYLVREMGNRQGESNILDGLGLLEFELENYDIALSYFEESVQIGRAINNPFMLNKALRHLGDTHKKLEIDDTYSYYYDALSVVQNTGLLPDKLYTVFDLVEEQIEKGNAGQAVQWLALILKHSDAYGEMEEVQNKLEELKQTLNAVEYQAAFEAGQALNLDTLIETILQEYEATNE